MKKINLAFFVVAVLFLAACSKSKNDDTTVAISADYYLKGTLNNQALTWQVTDGVKDWVVGSYSSISNDKGVLSGYLGGLISASTTFKPQIGVQFRTYHLNYDQDKSAYFNSFLSTGTISFATTDNYTTGTKAFAITYVDAQGKQYSSIGTQTTSASIVSISPVAAGFGWKESEKIKVTFSCTLYPTDGTGSALTLTNAEATVRMENML
jgi:hypothetical protein